MAVLGIGVDIIEVERVRRQIERQGRGFLEGFLGASEIGRFAGRADAEAAYAACFAAKEALFKALGTGLRGGMAWRDVEVLAGGDGALSLRLGGETAALARARGVGRIGLSLARAAGHAGALVVLSES